MVRLMCLARRETARAPGGADPGASTAVILGWMLTRRPARALAPADLEAVCLVARPAPLAAAAMALSVGTVPRPTKGRRMAVRCSFLWPVDREVAVKLLAVGVAAVAAEQS